MPTTTGMYCISCVSTSCIIHSRALNLQKQGDMKPQNILPTWLAIDGIMHQTPPEHALAEVHKNTHTQAEPQSLGACAAGHGLKGSAVQPRACAAQAASCCLQYHKRLTLNICLCSLCMCREHVVLQDVHRLHWQHPNKRFVWNPMLVS